MASILLVIQRINRNHFKCNDLRNKILAHFLNVHYILNILKKNISVIADVFPKLETAKDMVTYMSKKVSHRTPFKQ